MSYSVYDRTLVILRRPPRDVYGVVGLVVLGQLLPFLGAGNLTRVAIALVLVLFLPGYALTAAVIPYAHDASEQSVWGGFRITLPERIALSFGLSVGVSALLGIGLAVVSPGFTVDLSVDVLSLIVLLLTVVGTGRRLAIPPGDRYVVPVRRWRRSANGFVTAAPRATVLATGALVVTAAVTFGAMGYVVTQPLDGSNYTGFQLVTQDRTGAYVAGAYPTTRDKDGQRTLTFVVRNREHAETTYTVLVYVERITPDGTIAESTEVKQYRRTVAAGDDWRQQHTVTVSRADERWRLTYLLYRGDPSPNPRIDTAYRHLYLWLGEGAERDT